MNFNNPNEQKNVISVFYGIDKGERIPDGYFAESFNMTSSKYPCLASRSERAKMVYEEGIMAPGEPVTAIEYNGSLILACSNGMIMYEDKIVDGYNKTKDIVQFGNQVYCAPSGLLIKNGFSDFSFSEAALYGTFNVTFCDSAFSDIAVSSGDKPTSPANGQYWYDSENKGLYKYSTASSEWITVPVMYVKLSSDEYDFSVFNEGDALTVIYEETIEAFVSAVFKGSIIIEGVFNPGIVAEEKNLGITRQFPAIQHICVHNNRVWGCNYSEEVNEIYASKLGDPLNWYCYRGLSTDSYAVSCGEPGAFTGCAELGDTVVFFKENCIYTVYGTQPANFQTVKTDCFGVQEGSEKSICRINGQVYYKSCHGVMRLSEGALPVCISDELGTDIWSDAVAGTDGRKYYIVMTDIKGRREMFVYDTKQTLWHKEELPCEDIFAFMTYKNNLLCIGKTETTIPAKPERLCIVEEEAPQRKNYNNFLSYFLAVMNFNFTNIRNKIMFLRTNEEIKQFLAQDAGVAVSEISNEELYAYMSSFMILRNTFEHKINFAYITNELTCNAYLPVVDGEAAVQKNEGRFSWEVQTGIRGFEASEYKRLKAVEIRMKLTDGAKCNVDVEYDGNGPWKSVGSFDTPGMTTFRTTARFNKCDTFRLKFYGYGDVFIYSIAEIYEEVGEIGF
ncbi:MAG: hypothetical protein IKJ88_05455 [Clostridia bacterium]|nr:hypothetical protein [Clostridia bacterium]